MKPIILFATIVASCVAFGGCIAAPPHPVSAAEVSLSFATDVQPILDRHCVICHQPNGFAALSGITLDLRSAVSYEQILKGTSSQSDNEQLIFPGNPDASFFFDKVAQDTPRVGTRMPQSDRLSEAEIDVIREWIAQGAQP